ncbi:hypothetical protein BCY89_17950 [Sphingobacterium siyangense]|uniref:Uncharacterized protein n=1 Tax=Sphingobacterium siyangense TaxID=459529 RepID=A0A420FD18_9SPHI|nr:hypothetical protein BCY89_17950 [Sphingobacterium siyangense]
MLGAYWPPCLLILCLFSADWLLFNYHFSRETAKKHQRNGKRIANHSRRRPEEDPKNKQRNGNQTAEEQQRNSKESADLSRNKGKIAYKKI